MYELRAADSCLQAQKILGRFSDAYLRKIASTIEKQQMHITSIAKQIQNNANMVARSLEQDTAAADEDLY